ncbi:M48 family metallopeptidase [Noviherbaspirillum sp.]|uniref:M48 family metallopeptidase n=1 Tax=Noviherbaspirillum sp. TaxID=1926288 RepID=UPI002FE1E423
MNFFRQQDHARRQTRTLIILFLLAVIAIVIAVNAAMTLVWIGFQGGYSSVPDFFPKGFFATNTLVTVALIAVGTLIETYNLRDGGDAVAKMAGGRLVSAGSRDIHERRLLNVVQEMSLASGLACPSVYLLDNEDAINAFAAGFNQNEAVVVVTRGLLRRLTRDELQGVVAHEFSHILNGDMRLNIRLIGVLFGIQMVAGFGQHLIDAGVHGWHVAGTTVRRPSPKIVLLAVGGTFLVIGYIGIFFGRLIKAAVSRQREYLADASAVQFTRSADGIGGALRKIGGLSRTIAPGSRIRHPNAEQLSHLFLGAPKASLVRGLFATHPPIAERLRRIYGRHVALLDAPEMAEVYEGDTSRLPDIPYVASGFTTQPQAMSPTVTFASSDARPVRLPDELDSAMREPHAACAVVYALLVAYEPGLPESIAVSGDSVSDPHFAILRDVAAQRVDFILFLARAVRRLPRSARLPLLDLAMPALKELSADARARFLADVQAFIAADKRITLAEFVLQTVLIRRLDAHAGRAIPVRYHALPQIRDAVALLLSLTAHVGVATATSAANNFLRGAARCPELGLSATDLTAASAVTFDRIRDALDRAAQLAPLAKPALVKALLESASGSEPLPVAAADLLRAICAALEAPIPPLVAATYTACHW